MMHPEESYDKEIKLIGKKTLTANVYPRFGDKETFSEVTCLDYTDSYIELQQLLFHVSTVESKICLDKLILKALTDYIYVTFAKLYFV